MKYQKPLTTVEILGIAIQSEIESARYYQSLKHIIRSPALKDKLGFLVTEEQKHRRILMDYYNRKFPDINLSRPPVSALPRPAIPRRGTVRVSALLKIALEAEESAENFYLTMARDVNDIQGAILLRYLARVEDGHYHLLKNELDLMEQSAKLKELKALYQSDEAVHLGP